MRRNTDRLTWIIAGCGAVSVLFAVYVFVDNPALLFGGAWAPETFALLWVSATMVAALALALPIWAREREKLSRIDDRTAELEVAVVTDPLTKLYNRRYLEDALREYLDEFLAINAPLAVMTLDLDHFKSVNDTYGHDAGDMVLRELAKTLLDVTREHDIVARTGGEEFCIVAPFATADQIRPFAERICRVVGDMRVDIGSVVIRPTISIGVASTMDGLTTASALIKVSDERLYLAKDQGRNRVAA